MKIRITALAASLAIGAALAFTSAGAALATGPGNALGNKNACATPQGSPAPRGSASLEGLRAVATCQVDRRLTTLTTLSSRVTASKWLTASDKATLGATIETDRTALTALKTTIAGETTLAALKADMTKVVSDYRVYVLLTRQVALTEAADAIIASQSRLATINTNLTAKIAEAKAAGKDTTAAEADLAKMNQSAANAVALATPLPAQILGLTPSQFNSGSAATVLASARSTIGQARADLKSAVASAKACREALK
jgi:hypothetical protein